MKSLCAILLSGDTSEAACLQVTQALGHRGFEVFAERPMPDGAPDGFQGGRVLISFNCLMTGQHRRERALFPDLEVEKAAHLLATTLPDAASRLRVSISSETALLWAKRCLSAGDMTKLEQTIAMQRAAMTTELPVLADLSRFQYRAKVELIDWNGHRAIKKTFRPTALDALAREQAFYDDICPHSDVPPRLLDRSDTALVFEWIDNRLQERRLLGLRLPIPLPLARVRELADFTRLVVARGWDPIDLSPGNNILIDRSSGKLRAIDFEFAHRHQAPRAPEQAYFLSGVPKGAAIACPLMAPMDVDPYSGKWRPYTGLSKSSFLHDPAWLQRAKRLGLHPFWLLRHVVRGLLRRRRHAAKRDRLLRPLGLSSPPS